MLSPRYHIPQIATIIFLMFLLFILLSTNPLFSQDHNKCKVTCSMKQSTSVDQFIVELPLLKHNSLSSVSTNSQNDHQCTPYPEEHSNFPLPSLKLNHLLSHNYNNFLTPIFVNIQHEPSSESFNYSRKQLFLKHRKLVKKHTKHYQQDQLLVHNIKKQKYP